MSLRELLIFVMLGVYGGGALIWFDKQRKATLDAIYLLALIHGIAWLVGELAAHPERSPDL